MAFNFGAFGGGLSQGLNNGMELGRQIQAQIDARNVRDLQQQGMKEAQAAREQAIGDSIKQNGLQGPASDQNATDAATAAATNASPALGGIMAGTDASQSPAAQMQPQTDVSAAGSTPQFSKDQPTSYTVGGKDYADFDSAHAAAEKNAPSSMDYFIKDSIPKVADMYLAQGDAAKAQAWQDWAQKQQNQESMKTWAHAYQAAQMGDMDTASDLMVKLYDKVDDGISVVKKKPTLDENGQLKSYTITLKQDKTGKTWDQEITPQALMNVGMAGLSPDKQFELQYKTATDAAAARAKYAAEAAHDEATFKRDVAKKGIDAKIDADKDWRTEQREVHVANVQSGNRIQEDTIKSQLETSQIGEKEKAKIGSKIDALRSAGYGDDDIKGMMPMLLNAESYKKMTSPDERRSQVYRSLAQSDIGWSRKTAEQQAQAVDNAMNIINAGGGTPGSPAPSGGKSGNPFQNPAAGGLPASGAAPAGKSKGIPVYDSQTGKIVYQ